MSECMKGSESIHNTLPLLNSLVELVEFTRFAFPGGPANRGLGGAGSTGSRSRTGVGIGS